MPTTSNFGWTTPADTDLVKDGASAIRTLGNNIDTSLVDLKGGTTGQVLSKNSNTDLDFTWVAQDDSSAIQNAIVDAKGDLISATAADTPARLAVGTDGQYLKADSTTATGLAWGTVSSGGMTLIATATPSAATTISFTSIPTTYKQLYLTWYLYHSSNAEYLYVRLNNDSVSTYVYNGLDIASSSVTPTSNSASGFGDNNVIPVVGYSSSSSTRYRHKGHMIIDSADGNGMSNHNVHWQDFGHNGTANYGSIASGTYLGTSAVSRIDFLRSGTQTITGTVLLYGVS